VIDGQQRMNIYQFHDVVMTERAKGERRKLAQRLSYIVPIDVQVRRSIEKENKQIFNPIGTTYGK